MALMINYPLTILIWTITSSIAIGNFAHAFVPSNNAKRHSNARMIIRHPRLNPANTLLHTQNNSNNNDDDDSEDDAQILDELLNTKNEMFGVEMPTTEELKDAASNAENAFLAAMLVQTNQFQQIKNEGGGEKAVDAFMDLIQEEDEEQRRLDREEGGSGDVDDEVGEDEDLSSDKNLLDQMMQNDNGDVEEGGDANTDNVDIWQ